MLIKRLITACVLIPIVIVSLFWLPMYLFVALMAGICGLAAWEWSQFLHYRSLKRRYCFTFICIVINVMFYVIPVYLGSETIIFSSILKLSVVWWLVALVLVIGYPASSKFWGNNNIIKSLFAYATLVPFYIGMIELRHINYSISPYYGASLLLYVFVLVWATDSGAYFAGKLLGKRKLAPHVSPGKTIEGLLGGVITSTIIVLFVDVLNIFDISFNHLIIASILAILSSVLGDLTESMLKREANLKDSGNLIPGHGGLLDRIDSLTAAIPVFAGSLVFLI
ncbi:phosphatidate cytidylyltransferase [Orbaceae bacterium ac157xtp]